MKLAPPMLGVLLLSSIPSPQVWALDSSYTADGDSDFFWVGGRERNLGDARGDARSKAIDKCRKAGGHEQTNYVMKDETGVTYSNERCKHRVFMGSDEYLCRATATVKCGLEEAGSEAGSEAPPPEEPSPEELDCNRDGKPDFEFKKGELFGKPEHPAATVQVSVGGEPEKFQITPDMYERSLKQKQYNAEQVKKYEDYYSNSPTDEWKRSPGYKALKGMKTDMEKYICERVMEKPKEPSLIQKVDGWVKSKLRKNASEAQQKCLQGAQSEKARQKCYPGQGRAVGDTRG